MKVQSILALAVVALAAAACGGGGGGSTPSSSTLPGGITATPAPVGNATTPASNGSGPAATFKIVIPATGTSSASRRAQNIATGSQSITIQLIDAGGVPVTGTPQTFALTSTSPGCASANGSLTCTLSVSAPLGDDVFLAQTYASTDGTGALLSSGAVRVTIAANATNAATLSLDGSVASVFLASANGYLGASVPSSNSRANPQSATRQPATTGTGAYVASTRIFVIALDNENNAILNPTTYSTPISLQQTFANGAAPNVTLSVQSAATGATTSTSANYGTVTVNSPSDLIMATLINNVSNGSYADTIAGYIGSAPSNSASPNPLPSNVASLYLYTYQTSALSIARSPWQILSLASAADDISGGGGTYSVSAPTCSGIVSLSVQYGYDPNSYIYTYQIVATPIAVGGPCSATLSDSVGDSPITIPITVTTTSVSGS
jgi:hypothetical protein